MDLVWAPGAFSHLDLWWENPYYARLFERMSSFTRLILFDKRGTGLSDRPATVATLEGWGRLQRTSMTPAARVALSNMNARIDIRAILPTIQVPTLVLVREDDPIVAVDEARAMAGLIPGARFMVLPGQGQLFFDIWEEMVALSPAQGSSSPTAASMR